MCSIWDVVQVVLLLYVSITVPLRACFDITTELWSFGFFFDACVDMYFICDCCLNFRTAIYLKDGTREDRVNSIAWNYVRGWFVIDLVSSLPISYITYFADAPVDTMLGAGSRHRPALLLLP